jgi:hypothetical protein
VVRAVGAAGLALSLTACMKMDMNLEINADDTVDGSVVMAFSRDFMDMAGMMGEDADMDDLLEGFMDFDPESEDVPDYASVEPYDDGDFVGQQMNFDGAPLEEFSEGADMSGMSIVREGDQFVFQGDMDMTDETGEMGDIPPGMLENMDFDLRVSITFPGEVLEHNGSLSGTTVTWEPQIGEPNDMFARAMDSGGAGGGMPVWLWIVIGVVIVAGLAGLLFFMSRSKGEPAPADAAAPVPAPVAPGMPGAPVPPPAPAESAAEPAGTPPAPPEAPAEAAPETPPEAALDSENTEGGVDVPDPAAPDEPDSSDQPRG